MRKRNESRSWHNIERKVQGKKNESRSKAKQHRPAEERWNWIELIWGHNTHALIVMRHSKTNQLSKKEVVLKNLFCFFTSTGTCQ